jgi:hypothetical protein
MKILATVFSFLCVCCLGHAQTPDTNRVLYVTTSSNLMAISNAVRIASHLRVGMADAEVQKYMQDQGVIQTNVNVYSISVDRGRTLAYGYPLTGGALLCLDMHCTKSPPTGLFGWRDPVLDGARIQSQGADIISIALTNGPEPGGAANRSQPVRSATNQAPAAAGPGR